MKYRIIVNGTNFYTTASAIKRGVGDVSLINKAVLSAYNSLQCMRDTYTIKPCGMSGHWHGYNVQIDLI